MAEIEEALKTYLLSQTGLTALIARRYFYDVAKQGEILPYVVCLCVSDVKEHTHQGQNSLESPNYQFTAYASTRAGARAVAQQIKTALCDYVGTMSGTVVQYITLQNELPSTETSADGTIKVHTVDLEFQIYYVRS